MKRYAILFSAAALCLGGCSNEGGGPSINNPFAKKSASAAAKADYFELRKDGKTYIVGSNDSRMAVMSGKMPKFKETAFDNGKSVYIESGSYASYNRLVADYKKAKGL